MYRRQQTPETYHATDECYSERVRHHRAGPPPWVGDSTALGRRFPHVDWEILGDLGTDHLEVTGLSGFSHVRCPKSVSTPCTGCGRYSSHADSIIVAIDGACPGNGKNATQSACGVYFGDFDKAQRQNLSWCVPDDPNRPHTNQRAELHAALGALKAVKVFARRGGQVDCDPKECKGCCIAKHIVIKSDSTYLVDSITDYIDKWRWNGWLTASKRPIANRDLWEEILIKISDIEELGVHVDFWHVPREMNTEADRLANLALSGKGFPKYSPLLGHDVMWFSED